MNPNEIINLIVSNDADAKKLLKSVQLKPVCSKYRYLYIRVFLKSIAQNKQYFPEYEEIFRIIFTKKDSKYSTETINVLDNFLRTLCLVVRKYMFVLQYFVQCCSFAGILRGILQVPKPYS